MTKYCPDVFKSIYLQKVDDKKIEVGFCCQNRPTETDASSIQQVLEEKRRMFLLNDQDKQCVNCWKIENQGGRSRRHASIQWFENHNVVFDDRPELISFDWNSENICNLACITCGPMFSSRWSSDMNKYSWQEPLRYSSVTAGNRSYETLDFSNLQRVYFNGGEPLLSSDHLEILELLESKDVLEKCEVAYNTNCTKIPSAQCVDLWRQARLVRLMLSIDAVGAGFDFIRWPAQWHQVLEFLGFIRSLDFNVQIDITCTLGIHNIFSLPSLLEWQASDCSHNHQGDPVTLNLQPCGPISQGGRVLSIDNIGWDLAQQAKEFIQQNIPRDDVIHLFDFSDHPGRSDLGWKNYLDEISKVRKISWRDHLPELSAISSIPASSGR